MKKKKTTGAYKEAIAEVLADWFWGHRSAELVSYKALENAIREAKKQAKVAAWGAVVTKAQAGCYISQVRRKLERKYDVTLVNVHQQGYKIASDMEYADFTMGWARRTMAAAARTVELAPRVKAQCVGPALKKAFEGHKDNLKALAAVRHEFSSTMQQWRKGINNADQKVVEVEAV